MITVFPSSVISGPGQAEKSSQPYLGRRAGSVWNAIIPPLRRQLHKAKLRSFQDNQGKIRSLGSQRKERKKTERYPSLIEIVCSVMIRRLMLLLGARVVHIHCVIKVQHDFSVMMHSQLTYPPLGNSCSRFVMFTAKRNHAPTSTPTSASICALRRIKVRA